jgi:hypothetical protein
MWRFVNEGLESFKWHLSSLGESRVEWPLSVAVLALRSYVNPLFVEELARGEE